MGRANTSFLSNGVMTTFPDHHIVLWLDSKLGPLVARGQKCIFLLLFFTIIVTTQSCNCIKRVNDSCLYCCLTNHYFSLPPPILFYCFFLYFFSTFKVYKLMCAP